MSGSDIVARLKNKDAVLVQTIIAMSLPFDDSDGDCPLSEEIVKSMFESGFVDACLEDLFQFPLSIEGDTGKSPEYLSPSSIKISPTGFRMAGGVVFHHEVTVLFGLLRLVTVVWPLQVTDKYKAEVAQKLSPLIMLLSNKKRRLFGTTDNWWVVQTQFFALLDWITESNDGANALYSLPNDVVSALLEQMVLIVTVSPTVLLRNSASRVKNQLNFESGHADMIVLVVLSIACNLHDSQPTLLERLVMTRAPVGAIAGLVGQTFASCFHDVAAQTYQRLVKKQCGDEGLSRFLVVFCGLQFSLMSGSSAVRTELSNDAKFENICYCALDPQTRMSKDDLLKATKDWAEGRMSICG